MISSNTMEFMKFQLSQIIPDSIPPVVSLVGSTPVEVEETGTLSDGVWSWREHNSSIGSMIGVAEIESVSPYRAKIISTEYNTYGSMYFFKTYPREIIEDKDVRVKYQLSTSGTQVPRLYFQIVDGAFDRTSLTDFPSGAGRILKGNGVLAQNNINYLQGSPTHTLTASGGTEDFITIFVVTYDAWQQDHNVNGFIEFIEIVGVESTTFDNNTVLSAVGGSGSNEYGTFTSTALSQGYTELGSTCLDDIDGQIDGNVVVGGDVVDSSTVRQYTVDYDCQDTALNSATTVQRVVNVISVTPPVVTLIGETPDIEVISGTYTELGATCFDNEDGQINGSVVIGGDSVNINSIGIYDVDYDCQDSGGLDADTVVRMVAVVDTTMPLLALNGDAVVFLEAGLDTYSELSAMCLDLLDGQIDGNVVISGDTVDQNTIGTYVVDYDCDDANSNSATTIQRTVNVSDTIAPIIIVTKEQSIMIIEETIFDEFEFVICEDSFAGDLTNSMITTGTVNTLKRTVQTVDYTCSDGSNQSDISVSYAVNKISTSSGSSFPVPTVPQLSDIPTLSVKDSPTQQTQPVGEGVSISDLFSNLFGQRLDVSTGETILDSFRERIDEIIEPVQEVQQQVTQTSESISSVTNTVSERVTPIADFFRNLFSNFFS